MTNMQVYNMLIPETGIHIFFFFKLKPNNSMVNNKEGHLTYILKGDSLWEGEIC